MAKYDKLLSIANAEVGYLEKRTNADLDSKTGNAGSNNYTKYARDLAGTNWYNGSKQGYAWCTTFADWCFIQAYGYKKALELQGFPEKSLAAVVTYARNYYAAKGRLFSSPEVGDRVFFGDQHTGIVVGVSGNTVTTIEGNTSGGSAVISNGGGVCKKSYTLGKTAMTFGRPDWSLVEDATPAQTGKSVSVTLPQVSKGSKGSAVKSLQILLNGYGANCGTADGDFGSKTDKAVKTYQAAKKLTADGIVGAQTWGALLNG